MRKFTPVKFARARVNALQISKTKPTARRHQPAESLRPGWWRIKKDLDVTAAMPPA